MKEKPLPDLDAILRQPPMESELYRLRADQARMIADHRAGRCYTRKDARKH